MSDVIVHGGDLDPDESNLTQLVGSDLWVRSEQWFTFAGGDLPYVVTIRVAHDGHTTRAVEVHFAERDGRQVGVTSSALRRIPIDDLVRTASQELRVYTRRDDGNFVPAFFSDGTDKVAMDRATADGRRRTPREDLERVAEVYLHAVATGQPPAAAVEEQMRLPNRNTARKWVQRARAAGLLPPAPGERRGGV